LRGANRKRPIARFWARAAIMLLSLNHNELHLTHHHAQCGLLCSTTDTKPGSLKGAGKGSNRQPDWDHDWTTLNQANQSSHSYWLKG